MGQPTVAEQLAHARLAGERLADYPAPMPQTLDEAYEIQNQVTSLLGTPIVGWKIGATSKTVRERLGIEEPLSGPLLQNSVLPSPCSFAVAPDNLRIVEAEIAFRLSRDLPPRVTPYSKDDVAHSIATVHPVFELASKRLPGSPIEDPRWMVADGGINQALIFGAAIEYEPTMNMAQETVEVRIDGKIATSGIGSTALGDPLAVVVWLANHLSERNIALRAGDWVSTGLLCDLLTPARGATTIAEFKTIGSVELKLT